MRKLVIDPGRIVEVRIRVISRKPSVLFFFFKLKWIGCPEKAKTKWREAGNQKYISVCQNGIRKCLQGLPRWSSGDIGSIPSQETKVLLAVGLLSPCAATEDPECCNPDPVQPKSLNKY